MPRRAASQPPISLPAITPTHLARASCCAAFIYRQARCRGRTHSGDPRSHIWADPRCLLIGTRAADELLLTVTAATVRPVQLRLRGQPTERSLREAIDVAIPTDLYLDDVHGSPEHRRHLTHYFAREICEELFGP